MVRASADRPPAGRDRPTPD